MLGREVVGNGRRDGGDVVGLVGLPVRARCHVGGRGCVGGAGCGGSAGRGAGRGAGRRGCAAGDCGCGVGAGGRTMGVAGWRGRISGGGLGSTAQWVPDWKRP